MKKDKSLEGEAKFRPNSFHHTVFNNDKKIYGEDVELKHVNLFLAIESAQGNKIQYIRP